MPPYLHFLIAAVRICPRLKRPLKNIQLRSREPSGYGEHCSRPRRNAGAREEHSHAPRRSRVLSKIEPEPPRAVESWQQQVGCSSFGNAMRGWRRAYITCTW
jgi:hypothetical protein